ncbi:peptidoglycan D,D-transpeptidase FtsI family protein [Streptomyces poonensis]|uniref:Penicillin-binding protein n=1 Tax=Streptomyces poonensis TaxID=68255 RepID=A0A918Q5T8_9ACTN|nr:penicillin-binding transpeptidase domain-containing protein [Streptomyces poonensis]GGZ33874.1 penicillin-binding protein [Streptomyces poonensis]GLJ89224.1 penicillin-binding protein [Streptomyces poonensis]
MNKTIRRTAVFTLLLVFALLIRATWVQFYDGQALADDKNNRRNVMEQYAQPLGDIIVAGEAITGSARTQGSDLHYKRTYTDGELYAAVTGYGSQVYGATQLEGIYKDLLDGTDTELKNPLEVLTKEPAAPGDVVTTIEPDVQKAAYEALGDKKGAAVAIDPATGRILAVVSTPSYDPGTISGSGSDDAAAWQKLTKDEDKPLVNRALRQPLPPGSTFKLVVAAAALEDGLHGSVDERTDSPDPYTLPGTTTVLRNESSSAPCENATIRTALQYSCNNVFAKLAVDLGQDKVRAMAEKFGFDDELDVPVRAYASVYPSDMDEAQTALSGIGQFDVTATPLQMAMVSAAIANDGKLVSPHMVAQTSDADGTVLEDYDGDTETKEIVSSSTAEQLRSAMQTVVEEGTGTNARVSGATVGGKTGTAQHGENNSKTPYAWFTSYAKSDTGDDEVAVAVIVEQSDAARSEVSGNGLAAPVAQAMMEAALEG